MSKETVKNLEALREAMRKVNVGAVLTLIKVSMLIHIGKFVIG